MHRSLARRGPSRFTVLLAALLALAAAACVDLTPSAEDAPAPETVSEAPEAAEEPADDGADAAGDEAEDADDDAAGDEAADDGDAAAGDAAADEGGAAARGAEENVTEEAAAAAAAGELTEEQVADVLATLESDISIAQVRNICDNSLLRSLAASQIAEADPELPSDLLDQVCEALSE